MNHALPKFRCARGYIARAIGTIGFGFGALIASGSASAIEPIRLRIMGGLAGVTQYQVYEEPFWSREIRERSAGRIEASIQPIDRSGLRGQDALQLMKLGVTSFGTTNLSVASSDDPELGGVDLPGLSPDFATLRRATDAYKPVIKRVLDERYGVELLGLYTYPAQVLYCVKPFKGFADLSGRRIRTASPAQSNFVDALGATPVLIPFAETVGAVTKGVVDCAITGTLSGFEIGLSDVTSHLHALAINWGLTLFAANKRTWHALPEDARAVIIQGVTDLETRIWNAAEQETARGIACDTGAQACAAGRRGRMSLVPVSARDDALRKQILVERLLPSWIARCGSSCIETWNQTLGPALAIPLSPP